VIPSRVVVGLAGGVEPAMLLPDCAEKLRALKSGAHPVTKVETLPQNCDLA